MLELVYNAVRRRGGTEGLVREQVPQVEGPGLRLGLERAQHRAREDQLRARAACAGPSPRMHPKRRYRKSTNDLRSY